MTINRIDFEDRGQDFLWWEIDMETGRVVGCGPKRAAIFADGKHSVATDTIVLGQRPRIFVPDTGLEGRWLKYAIVSIALAPEPTWCASHE